MTATCSVSRRGRGEGLLFGYVERIIIDSTGIGLDDPLCISTVALHAARVQDCTCKDQTCEQGEQARPKREKVPTCRGGHMARGVGLRSWVLGRAGGVAGWGATLGAALGVATRLPRGSGRVERQAILVEGVSPLECLYPALLLGRSDLCPKLL